jgi:hypothetical protein
VRAIWRLVMVLRHGRPNAQTLAEQKRAVWGGMPVRYRVTRQRKARTFTEWAKFYDRRAS